MLVIRSCICVWLMFAAGSLYGGVIANGDFSGVTPLAGFDATGAVSEPTGEFAQFSGTGDLSQQFEIPSVASVLSFDIEFSTLDSNAIFKDSFAASLTTTDAEVLDLFVVDQAGLRVSPSSGNPSFVPFSFTQNTSVSIPGFSLSHDPNALNYHSRITVQLPSTVLGDNAKLLFRSLNSDTSMDSLSAVDNISIMGSNAAVPEPASLTAWFAVSVGLPCLLKRRRRRLYCGCRSIS